MDSGFEKADSSNLPVIDVTMINEYFAKTAQYLSSEIKNVKTERATREKYGDEAIGFVQLKRQYPLCTIKSKITPEHRVKQKGYQVTVVIDEEKEEILTSTCQDCAASAGGCKHSVAVLLWLHRRSEEPSVTSVTCYWRSSKLSNIGKIEPLKIKDMCKHANIPALKPKNSTFRQMYEEKASTSNSESILNCILRDHPVKNISVHCLYLKYSELVSDNRNADEFVQFMKDTMTENDCKKIEELTVLQSKSSVWYQVRFGRITASKIYEASRCKTMDGVLVENILGSTEVPMTDAIKRGQQLEKKVLEEVSLNKKIIMKHPGIIINPKYPIFGASPDGLTDDLCIEVKCPSKEKTVQNYIDKNGVVCKKPYSQLQMQMFLTNKQHGLLCVASPSFENDKKVNIVEVDLDLDYCHNLMSEAFEFWKMAIYPKFC